MVDPKKSKTIGFSLGIQDEKMTNFKTTVWEENQGCLTLANMDVGRHTPRSKHYAIKQHWFRSHLKPNKIVIDKIESSKQKADILTKGLGPNKFKEIRRLLCGW